MVLFRNGPPNPDFGESLDPNGLQGVLEVFARARFPPNPTKPNFLGNFLGLGGFGQGPWPSPIGKGHKPFGSLVPGPWPWSLVPVQFTARCLCSLPPGARAVYRQVPVQFTARCSCSLPPGARAVYRQVPVQFTARCPSNLPPGARPIYRQVPVPGPRSQIPRVSP